MDSHEIDYEILGKELQVVEIELDPGETVIAEAGAMNYMEDGIEFEAIMGDGSTPNSSFWNKLGKVGSRILTGESLILTHFTNKASGKKRVAFAAPYPGNIVPMNLASLGGELICQKDAFLCAAKGTTIDIAFNKKIGVGLFGGEGFILQRLRGNGMAFIHAGGTVVTRNMTGNRMLVDTGCIAAFTTGISYNITQSGNLKSMFFGGEGLFFADMQGYGSLYLQSLPFSRLARRVTQSIPTNHKGEGSVLGGIGDMIMGNRR